MPRRPSATLTDAEVRLMNILWIKGRATVANVVEALTGKPTLAYNTVLTMMRILERKGYVAHDKLGRAFVYRPVVDRVDARRHALRHLAHRLFDDSPGLLVLSVMKDENLDGAELRRLKELIDTSE